ncbi:MAG TPA: FGGY family carbohydrate kinase [Anaerolineaceae bacterium]|nr:FGGY family carbohydrate kinase [Anaerolineaceae bacterium]
MNLIGLDIGTTGCKASLFADDGQLLGSASREYPVDIPQPGWAEQNAERVWRLAQEALRQVLAAAGICRVAALGLSVQGEAVMPVDADGQALRPAILGMDTRTGTQNEWLSERFGAEYLFQHTGMPVHTINTLPKLLWLKQNEPEIWKQAAYFRLYEDFLIQKMTGKALISRCLASRTQLFDLPADDWSDKILQVIQLDRSRLSTVSPSGVAAGEMLPDLAEGLGLKNRPLVVTGGHDQACGALGVGLVRPGLSMVSTGTAEVMEVALATPTLTSPLERGNISVYAHVVTGLYLAMTLNHSGGLVLRWFRDSFCKEEMNLAEAQHQDPYDLIFEDVVRGPSPLLLVPHFAGSGTPDFDTQSKGVLIGLTFATTRQDIAKAILEGLTFELRYNLEVLKAGQVDIKELRAIGGGARSKLWLQIKADVTGIPVCAPKVTEAASWGAAILGGIAAGCFSSPLEGVERALEFNAFVEPDPHQQALYEPRYHLYRSLYPLLKQVLHEVGKVEK